VASARALCSLFSLRIMVKSVERTTAAARVCAPTLSISAEILAYRTHDRTWSVGCCVADGRQERVNDEWIEPNKFQTSVTGSKAGRYCNDAGDQPCCDVYHRAEPVRLAPCIRDGSINRNYRDISTIPILAVSYRIGVFSLTKYLSI